MKWETVLFAVYVDIFIFKIAQFATMDQFNSHYPSKSMGNIVKKRTLYNDRSRSFVSPYVLMGV